MGTSGASGVIDTELVGVQKQGGGIANFQSFLFLVKAKLLGGNSVDEPVTDGR